MSKAWLQHNYFYGINQMIQKVVQGKDAVEVVTEAETELNGLMRMHNEFVKSRESNKPKEMYYVLKHRGDGKYQVSDAIKTFTSNKLAQKFADRKNEEDASANLVVRPSAYVRSN